MATRPVGECTTQGCDEHYACRMRGKGIQTSPRLMTTRTLNMLPTPVEPPAYNKEIMYSERPGGTKVPLINPNTGHVIRKKEYVDNQHRIESIRRNQHNAAVRI